jgi:hypothetical protein
MLSEASTTSQPPLVVPFDRVEPDGGSQNGVPIPGQLSDTIGAGNVTSALHTPGSVFCVMLAGQEMVGFWVSFTVSVKSHVAVLLELSVAVQVTVVVPFGKADPLAGEHISLTPGQLSVPVAVKVRTALHMSGSVLPVTLAGHWLLGAWVSFTVTVKAQDGLPALESVQVTVVVPLGKKEPDAGAHP